MTLLELRAGSGDLYRHDMLCEDFASEKRNLNNFAVLGGFALILIEDKIAERVEDQAIAIALCGLDDMRMMADDE